MYSTPSATVTYRTPLPYLLLDGLHAMDEFVLLLYQSLHSFEVRLRQVFLLQGSARALLLLQLKQDYQVRQALIDAVVVSMETRTSIKG